MEHKRKIKNLENKIKALEEKNEMLRLYAEVLKEYLIQELSKGKENLNNSPCRLQAERTSPPGSY